MARYDCPPPGGAPDGTGAVAFDSTEVDVDAVALRPAGRLPVGRVGARAVARFVIDTTGQADPRTVTIEPGADSAFASAVRAFLPRARFSPALLAGCRVRVWARWPFRVESTGREKAV